VSRLAALRIWARDLAASRGSTATTHRGICRALAGTSGRAPPLSLPEAGRPRPNTRAAAQPNPMAMYCRRSELYPCRRASQYLERHNTRLVALYGSRARLPRYLGAEDRAVLAAHRAKVAAAKALADREALARLLAVLVRSAYDRCGYRRAEGRWAGGAHTVTVTVGGAYAGSSTSTAWSRNGKWRGLDSAHRLVVSPTWREDVYELGRAVVDGALVLAAEELAPADYALLEGERVASATVVVQARGTEIRAEAALLYRTAEGVWHRTAESRLRRAVAVRQRAAQTLRSWRPEGWVELPRPGSLDEWIKWSEGARREIPQSTITASPLEIE
jgi:hypothetical protein